MNQSNRVYIEPFRNHQNEVAIIFIHGYSGYADRCWTKFLGILDPSDELKDWDFISIGYTTSLYPDIRSIWTAKPPIQTLAGLLRTYLCEHDVFRGYKQFCIIAHSMGGLVVQRALLDHPGLCDRVSHFFQFGTPSNGLKRASQFKFWNRQVNDLAENSDFIQSLKNDRLSPFSFQADYNGMSNKSGDSI